MKARLMLAKILCNFHLISRKEYKFRCESVLLLDSGFFDRCWYLIKYRDVAKSGMNPADHYVRYGWREGRNPNSWFDTKNYLAVNPDVKKAGLNPLVHYILYGLREMRRLAPPEVTKKSANPNLVAQSSVPVKTESNEVGRFFLEGYAALYPDVVRANIDLTEHWLKYGKKGGRSNGLEAPTNKGGGALFQQRAGGISEDPGKPYCIIVAHESSRTGCPINTWSMLRVLNKHFNVLAVSLGGGVLDSLFQADSFQFAVFDKWVRGNSKYIEAVLGKVLDSRHYKFAIVNSVVSQAVLPVLSWHRVPSVVCVHDFAQYCSPAMLRSCFLNGTQVVYSSEICLDSARRRLEEPELKTPIIAQGKSEVPTKQKSVLSGNEYYILKTIETRKLANKEFIVLGCGTIEYRKGFDMFIRVAAAVKRKCPNVPLRFLWAGGGYNPEEDHMSRFYKAQIDTYGLCDSFVALGSVEFMDFFYKLGDVFLLTSILDPLPGVVIEAMSHKLPVICFDKTSGFPEMFAKTKLESSCVVDYLDVDSMAARTVELIRNSKLRKDLSEDIYSFYRKKFNMTEYVSKIVEVASDAEKTFGELISGVANNSRDEFLMTLNANAARRIGITDRSRTQMVASQVETLIPVMYGLDDSISADAKTGKDLIAQSGGNIGNLAFNHAVRRRLFAVQPEVRPWHSSDSVVPESVGVIPCANQLGPHCDMSGAADWEWLKNADYPIVALGLGAQARKFVGPGILDYEVPFIHKGTRDWLKRIVEHAPTSHPNIALRGEFSLRVVKSLGFESSAVALGCPTLYISSDVRLGETIASRMGSFNRIALAAGQAGWGDIAKCENDLARIITECDGAFVAQADVKVVQSVNGEFMQLNENDRQKVRKHFRADLDDTQFDAWCKYYGRTFRNIPEWMEFYRQFDFVVGPRIHGVMVALQAGVPALCIAIDSRTTELCEIMHVPYVPAARIASGVTKEELKYLFKFDPADFDENRRMLANRTAEFLSNNKLSVSSHLKSIAAGRVV